MKAVPDLRITFPWSNFPELPLFLVRSLRLQLSLAHQDSAKDSTQSEGYDTKDLSSDRVSCLRAQHIHCGPQHIVHYSVNFI